MSANETASERDDATPERDVTVRREWHGRVLVLVVSGEIDMLTAPRFQDEVCAAVAEHTVLVDLSEVGFFASAGLSALVAGHERAAGHTGLYVVAPSRVTARPLQVTALDRRIPVYGTRVDALAALSED